MKCLKEPIMVVAFHSDLLRGQDCCGMQPLDAQYLSLGKLEGPTPCNVMVIRISAANTGKSG